MGHLVELKISKNSGDFYHVTLREDKRMVAKVDFKLTSNRTTWLKIAETNHKSAKLKTEKDFKVWNKLIEFQIRADSHVVRFGYLW